jgi:hypothetical protein
MTIRYNDGQTSEAVLVSSTETNIRLAAEGREDIVELTRINDIWVSDECEPVQVDFSFPRRATITDVKEEDCICSHALAARLIRMLYPEDEDVKAEPVPMARGLNTSTAYQVV